MGGDKWTLKRTLTFSDVYHMTLMYSIIYLVAKLEFNMRSKRKGDHMYSI